MQFWQQLLDDAGLNVFSEVRFGDTIALGRVSVSYLGFRQPQPEWNIHGMSACVWRRGVRACGEPAHDELCSFAAAARGRIFELPSRMGGFGDTNAVVRISVSYLGFRQPQPQCTIHGMTGARACGDPAQDGLCSFAAAARGRILDCL